MKQDYNLKNSLLYDINACIISCFRLRLLSTTELLTNKSIRLFVIVKHWFAIFNVKVCDCDKLMWVLSLFSSSFCNVCKVGIFYYVYDYIMVQFRGGSQFQNIFTNILTIKHFKKLIFTLFDFLIIFSKLFLLDI